MANGMGSLYIGVSGLHSAQTALNTTAHNLANINTEGYTRQQITFEDMTYLTVEVIQLINTDSVFPSVKSAESAIRLSTERIGQRTADWVTMKAT